MRPPTPINKCIISNVNISSVIRCTAAVWILYGKGTCTVSYNRIILIKLGTPDQPITIWLIKCLFLYRSLWFLNQIIFINVLATSWSLVMNIWLMIPSHIAAIEDTYDGIKTSISLVISLALSASVDNMDSQCLNNCLIVLLSVVIKGESITSTFYVWVTPIVLQVQVIGMWVLSSDTIQVICFMSNQIIIPNLPHKMNCFGEWLQMIMHVFIRQTFITTTHV